MKRIATVLIVGFLLAMAAPAFAKGASQVTLSGGGQRVTLTGDGEPHSNTNLSNFAAATNLYDGMWVDGPRIPEPKGDLGPRVTAVWLFIGPAEDIPIVQRLYPFAAGGPVGHILGGQVFIDEAVEEAWFPIADDIVDAIATTGFDLALLDPSFEPAAAPTSNPPPATAAPVLSPVAPTATATREAASALSPSDGSTSGLPWLLAAGVTAAAGAALARSGMMRRRNSRMV